MEPSTAPLPTTGRRAVLAGAAAAAGLTALGAPVHAATIGVPHRVTAWDPRTSTALPIHEFRGMWIATVLNIDWPSRPGLPVATQQAELDRLLRTAQQAGLNAVLLQVRAAGDRFYRSGLGEPWSRYLTGTLGRDPGWDPLAYAVARGAVRGLQVHAWINPYRVAMDALSSSLAPGSFAARNPGMTYVYGGRRYLDPAYPEVRSHVRALLVELVSRYALAGVHLDDYFYPYPSDGRPIPDNASWARFGAGWTSRADWRRENVAALIRGITVDVHAASPRAVFSVSPFGIWRNRSSHPAGSSTSGLQAYDDLYADTRQWLKNQYTDLFIPQLYWHQGYSIADYSHLAAWWNTQKAGTRTALAIGEAAYKVGVNWTYPLELPNHVAFTRRLSRARGNCFYNAGAVRDNRLGAMARITRDHYASRAVPVQMPWLGGAAPQEPEITGAVRVAGGERLTWRRPASGEPPQWTGIWRWPATPSSATPRRPMRGNYQAALLPGRLTTWTDAGVVPGQHYWYLVQSYSQTGIPSAAASAVLVRS